MRKVVDARQVCHLWANKSQDQARTSSGNIYFTGPTLYSYGSHFVIAHHMDNGNILWNDSGYSNTTARHKGHAWHALSRSQADNRVYVPSLNENATRDLERTRRDGDGKKLPELVQELVSEVVRTVQGMANMREGKGPESSAFHNIKKWEKSGLALCQYVAKGKHIPKWPLAPLPDVMPTGEARKAFIVSIAKSALLGEHADDLTRAISLLDSLASDADSEFDVRNWRIQNYRGQLDTIGSLLNSADKAYTMATGKNSAKVRNAWKRHAAISAIVLPIVARWELEQARYAIRVRAREAFRALRNRSDMRDKPHLHNRFSAHAMGHTASKMWNSLSGLPENEQAQYMPLYDRVASCAKWDAAEEALKRAVSSMATAVSYMPAWPADAVRHYTQARMQAQEAQTEDKRFAQLHAATLAGIIDGATQAIADAKEVIALKHAEKIAAWKAGENVSLPYESGTYARIKGNVVQTSRGASVPLSHACRLARVARRVIAQGGKEWAQGGGPRVGGFQVNRIGADGSAVIGCHEFDAEESLRMLDILDACPECQGITEDIKE